MAEPRVGTGVTIHQGQGAVFQLSTIQVDALAERMSEEFIADLTDELAHAFPELMQPLPRFVQLRMIGNGLDRAASLGLSSSGALAHFVALQCATAADFHRHPVIGARFDEMDLDDDEAQMARLVESVPLGVWEEIDEQAEIDDWFDAQDPAQQLMRVAARVCSRFPEAAQGTEPRLLAILFDRCVARAALHGVTSFDEVCVFAAALLLYGDIDGADAPEWAVDAFASGRAMGAAELIMRLRLAIVIDTDCFV